MASVSSMLPPGKWEGSTVDGDSSAAPPGVWNQMVPPGVFKRSSSKDSLLSTDVASSEDDDDSEVMA